MNYWIVVNAPIDSEHLPIYRYIRQPRMHRRVPRACHYPWQIIDTKMIINESEVRRKQCFKVFDTGVTYLDLFNKFYLKTIVNLFGSFNSFKTLKPSGNIKIHNKVQTGVQNNAVNIGTEHISIGFVLLTIFQVPSQKWRKNFV